MYRDVLQVNFPDDSSPVYVAVVIRHDIVHRSGRTKKGKTHNLREPDVEKLFGTLEAFVAAIDLQLETRGATS